jgi:hypothetical protein
MNLPPGTDKLDVRILEITVVKKGEPVFSLENTMVKIEDHAAGEFIIVKQFCDDLVGTRSIEFDADEWPTIRDAIDFMAKQIRVDNQD